MRASVFKAFLVVFACVAFVVPRAAFAFSPANVGATVSRLIGAKAAQMGFSPSDPRIAATRSAVSAVADSLVSGASGASWVLVAVQAGVGALLAAAPQPLGDGSVDQWTFNSDGTISISGNPQVSGGSVTPSWGALSSSPQTYWTECSTVSSNCAFGASPEAAATAYVNGLKGWSLGSCAAPFDGKAVCTLNLPANVGGGTQAVSMFSISESNTAYPGPACSSGMSALGSCVAYTPPPVTPQTVPLATAISDLPSGDEALPLAQPLMADVADALWQDAASQPGYQGLPYPVNNPVAAPDVSTVETASPSTYPSVGDLVSPAAAPAQTGTGTGTGTSSDPYSVSDPSSASTPAATDPGSGAQVNLGPDPGIGAPTLETIPTAAQILAPILGLLPDLRSYTVPAHTSVCPEPSFDLWGTTYTFTEQCDLLTQYGAEVTGACELGFAIAALFIVLSA